MAYLALDLGAGSGRAIVGSFVDGKIVLDEVHRFTHPPVKLGKTLYWNFLHLFNNIEEGISLAVKKGYKLKGIAVDTWGVDFGLIDSSGNLLSNPVCYRDSRTQGLSENIDKKFLYARTGIQQMDINTVFQLLSLKKSESSLLFAASKLLFTPDLINYFLTGKAFNEYTISSTSQMLNAQRREWDSEILVKTGIPPSMMQEIIHPGFTIGQLTDDLVTKTGAHGTKVFAVGSHDTASAIAAIPALGNDWAFLSSGTWSLLGILADDPVLSEEAMLNDFTNEGGVDNKILFMRNITGLWLLQRLIAEWERNDNCSYSYDYLISEALKTEAFRSIVNSDDRSFSNPASMSQAITEYCTLTGQLVPSTKGEFVRCVIESLAIKYNFVLKKIKECQKNEIRKLYVVGGGSQNDMLNQFTANALKVEVVVGLTEATAIGNILQQAIADGSLKGWQEAHEVVKNSFAFKSYIPEDTEEWDKMMNKVEHLFK